MTHLPAFPWQVLAALAVALLCFAAGVFVCLVAVGRTLKARRRELAHGGMVDLTDVKGERWNFPQAPPISDDEAVDRLLADVRLGESTQP